MKKCMKPDSDTNQKVNDAKQEFKDNKKVKLEVVTNIVSEEECRLQNHEIIDKYKSSVENCSLKIEDDESVTSLKFVDCISIYELTVMKCQNVKFTDIPLQVKTLCVYDSEIDCKGLDQMKQLTDLCIENNLVFNIQDLKFNQLTQLTYLMLSQCNIKTVKQLKVLKNLEYLNLSSNKIQKINGMEFLIHLYHLDLSKNQIKNIDCLKVLVNLSKLKLESNQIKSLNKLQNLTNLLFLNADCNQIKTLEPLKNLKQLIELSVNNNQLQNLEAIEYLFTLQVFNAQYNNIKDFSPLKYHFHKEEYNLDPQK
ncbi:leucine-rich_repeat-containing protein [Hexamita inflata]|uniref:Leucine-rich_repeat-containing protein n=1 Tax=Hexamita inflata TaxID=28002 RepID=A0ABP1H4F5_9EUKA